MRKFLLPVLFLGLLLTGCSDNEPIGEYMGLDVSQLSPEDLAGMTQEIDLDALDINRAGKAITVTVSQVIADPLAIHVFFTAEFETEIDPDLERTSTMTTYDPERFFGLFSRAEPLPYTAQLLQLRAEDEHTLRGWHSFAFPEPTLEPGMQLTYTLDGYQLPGTDQVFDSMHTFTWTVETDGPVFQSDLTDDTGAVVGSMTCSSLAYAVEWVPTDEDKILSAVLLNEDGTQTAGGHGSNLGTCFVRVFHVPIDPTTIAAVEVEDLTLDLS